jgi:hypothetical protein
MKCKFSQKDKCISKYTDKDLNCDGITTPKGCPFHYDIKVQLPKGCSWN